MTDKLQRVAICACFSVAAFCICLRVVGVPSHGVPYATRIAVVSDTPQAAQSAASKFSIPAKLTIATYGTSQVADADFQDRDALYFIGRSAGKKIPYVILADSSTPPVSVWEDASPAVIDVTAAIASHVKGGGK